MKICPTCSKTYTDETLNFCLADGAVLNNINQNTNSEATIIMGQNPPSNPTVVQPNLTNQTPFQPPTNPAFQPTNPTFYQPQSGTIPPLQQKTPVKKSKTWIWITAIVGVILVIGGVGFIGLIALLANIDTTDTNENVQTSPTPVVSFDSILKDDFSKWQVANNNLGNTEYSNGEFIMSSKQNGYYYVLLTAAKNYKTINASTKIVLRNVTGRATVSGYGLVIHSDPLKPLTKDYAFLIDTTKQSYRIVQHTPNNETELVSWTRFPAIRSGTQTNEIEVKDQNGKMSLFINSQFAITVNDSVNFKDGIFGLYVSDAVPIAFSNLQIVK